MKIRMRDVLAVAALAAFCSISVSYAADSPPPQPEPPKDSKLEAARAAIARQDWNGAQGVLREALATDASNADYHNLFAYSMRKAGTRDMDLVFKHYNEALRLNPKHRGAHEYIGEAYLLVGNLPKAKEHLKVLDGLCTFGCSEYSDLKKAVSDYEWNQTKK